MSQTGPYREPELDEETNVLELMLSNRTEIIKKNYKNIKKRMFVRGSICGLGILGSIFFDFPYEMFVDVMIGLVSMNEATGFILNRGNNHIQYDIEALQIKKDSCLEAIVNGQLDEIQDIPAVSWNAAITEYCLKKAKEGDYKSAREMFEKYKTENNPDVEIHFEIFTEKKLFLALPSEYLSEFGPSKIIKNSEKLKFINEARYKYLAALENSDYIEQYAKIFFHMKSTKGLSRLCGYHIQNDKIETAEKIAKKLISENPGNVRHFAEQFVKQNYPKIAIDLYLHEYKPHDNNLDYVDLHALRNLSVILAENEHIETANEIASHLPYKLEFASKEVGYYIKIDRNPEKEKYTGPSQEMSPTGDWTWPLY